MTTLSEPLLAATSPDYWGESRRPLAGLLFVLPIVTAYELGVLWYGGATLRNGADVWLRQLLELVGLGHYFLLPLLTVGGLLAWHHLSGDPWRVRRQTLLVMGLEGLGWAIVLIVVAKGQQRLLGVGPSAHEWLAQVASLAETSFIQRLVLFLGAGIYEETLFRLVLLQGSALAIQAFGMERGRAFLVAVLISSFFFAAAHYVGPQGDHLALRSFLFRFLAGGLFAGLFTLRGFGITVGAHAMYDILVGL